MTSPTPQYTALALRDIAAFLPVFEQPDFEFVRLVQPTSSTPGVSTFAYPSYHPEVLRFLHVIEQHGWVYGSPDFQWPTWMQTEEAARLRDDPTALASATPEQLAKLLTVFDRQERFCEGSMQGFYRSGLLTGILRRVAVLAQEGRA